MTSLKQQIKVLSSHVENVKKFHHYIQASGQRSLDESI